MPTPYGFDIALRDIPAGEELTEDYGLLNIIEEFEPQAEGSDNRGVVRGDDLARMAPAWDSLLAQALTQVNKVAQPLLPLCPKSIQQELKDVAQGLVPARSVSTMRF